jgi:glycosyltransferase involved in cell wall biosynthesis
MRIGIEAQRLFRPKKHGMDMVALEIIRHIQKIDKENQYFIYIKPDTDDCLTETANVTIRLVDGGSYPIWEQFALPNAVKKDNCQLLHCTSNTAPLFLSIPLVLTLHDIIFFEKSYLKTILGKGTSYQKFGNIYRKLVVPFNLKKVKTLVTVSEFEQKNIANTLQIPEKEIHVVYNGVGDHFKKIEDETLKQEFKNQYNLPAKFIFFMGNTDPKKNTPGVLKAYSIFRKKHDIPLVMIDYPKEELKQICREIGDTQLHQHIHLTGYIPNSKLPILFSLSTLFLYPSLRESFGIPIVEAQACGIPVITSNTSSMPEIAGENAIIVNPLDYNEIANAMDLLLTDTEKAESTSLQGLKNAKRFSWTESAKDMIQLYRSTILKY